MVSRTQLKLLASGASVAMGVFALGWQKHAERRRIEAPKTRRRTILDAARTLDRSAGLLAGSVALDSALEHYRGGYQNRAMYLPLAVSTLLLLASRQGRQPPRGIGGRLREPVQLLGGLTGLLGTGFHLYNVTKRPGGVSLGNLFYAAPIGAPAALALSALLGYYADRLRDVSQHNAPRVLGLSPGRSVSLLASAGLLGTAAEAGLLHFRGSFQNPAMYLPVTAPPLAAGLLASSALSAQPRRRLRWLSRLVLRLTACIGFAGSGFHALGIARNHGGWRNWRQTLQAGPPLPAPPSFTGLVLTGLAAHSLLDGEDDLSRYRWWR